MCCPDDQPDTRNLDVNFDFEKKPVYDINYNFSLHPLSGAEHEDFEYDHFENFTYENYYIDDSPPDYPSALGGKGTILI